MSEPRITYTPRPDATPEAEQSALAAVYRLVISHAQEKEANRPVGPDARKEINESGNPIIRQQSA